MQSESIVLLRKSESRIQTQFIEIQSHHKKIFFNYIWFSSIFGFSGIYQIRKTSKLFLFFYFVEWEMELNVLLICIEISYLVYFM